MQAAIMQAEPEVLEPSEVEVRIEQLTRAHEAVLRAGRDFIAAAAIAGHVLLDLRAEYKQPGMWRVWIEERLPFTYATAHLYMRCAEHEALIREQGWTHLNQVKQGLGMLVEPNHAAKGASGKGKPEWMKDLAREMHKEGARVAHIARDLGASPSAVKCWVDPDWNQTSRQKVAAINKRRIRAERALREQERATAIKAAVRKRGGALAEAYARAERDQDIIAQAQREATDSEERRILSEAGALQRRYRDMIVRALGVS
jgi:hypothetical protein